MLCGELLGGGVCGRGGKGCVVTFPVKNLDLREAQPVPADEIGASQDVVHRLFSITSPPPSRHRTQRPASAQPLRPDCQRGA
jgi:hypothetical protein